MRTNFCNTVNQNLTFADFLQLNQMCSFKNSQCMTRLVKNVKDGIAADRVSLWGVTGCAQIDIAADVVVEDGADGRDGRGGGDTAGHQQILPSTRLDRAAPRTRPRQTQQGTGQRRQQRHQHRRARIQKQRTSKRWSVFNLASPYNS